MFFVTCLSSKTLKKHIFCNFWGQTLKKHVFYIFFIILQKKCHFFNFQFFQKFEVSPFFRNFRHFELIWSQLCVCYEFDSRCVANPTPSRKLIPHFSDKRVGFIRWEAIFFDFFAFFYRFFRYFSIFSLFSEISVTLSSDRASYACAMNVVDGALQTPKPS